MPLDPLQRIGLALSGGGVRAAAFHAGVLKWLAERDMLKNVHHISSVSGGTLFTGLVLRSSEYVWPSSEQYLEETLPYIRTLLTRKSLQRDAILRLAERREGSLDDLNVVGCIKRHFNYDVPLPSFPD